MKSNFRQIFVYNLDIETKKRPMVLPPMREMLDALERRRLAGGGSMALQNGDSHITLAPIIFDDPTESAALLFRHSDRYSADSVYSDIAGNTFRAHSKTVSEGGEFGAHLVVSLAAEQGIPGRHTALLEKTPAVPAALIRRLINKMLHDEYDTNNTFFSYPSPAGQRDRQGKVVRDRALPRIDLDGQPSANLARDLQQGRLTGIVLTKAVTHTPVGGVPYLTKREATLKVAVDQSNLGGNILQDVKRAIASEAANYPVAQIGVQLPGRKKTVSVKLDTATGSPLSDMYMKSHDIWNISPPMAASNQNVVASFVDRIRPILISERNI